ncbi:30S ribosomal protein S2 [Candidatus Daviesbacteria bacterium]|nr:30S ribosomal protein S2 [Candidatus Daviesbacteria bacterium]
MQDLLTAGAHFGHKVSRAHPKMRQFIYGARDGVDIIDLAKTEEKLKEASQAAYELGKNGGVMLIMGTKKQARDIIESLAKEVDAPYLSVRWVGGLFTNFEEIKKNFDKLNKLKVEQEKGELSRYTKKEQLLISRKLNKFEIELGGATNLEKIPDAIFIIDAVSDQTAVKEAIKVGIKMFGICDTNSDPNWFDYPVPANDDGIKSIKMICETVIKAYGAGKKEAGDRLAKEELKKEEKKKTEGVADVLDSKVAEETAVLEEVIEKAVVEESERKPGRVEE